MAVRYDLSVPEAARLLSQSGGGGWVTTTPTQPELRLSNKHLALSIGERLCISSNVIFDVFFADLPTLRYHCDQFFDGHHCQRCYDDDSPGRTDIHELTKHEAAKMSTPVDCRSMKVEPRASDHGNSRADIDVEAFGGGNTLWFDIGTASMPRVSDGIAAAHVPGVTAAPINCEKRAHYDPLAAAHHLSATFIPLACELDGRWGDEAMDFFKTLSRRAGEPTGEQNS